MSQCTINGTNSIWMGVSDASLSTYNGVQVCNVKSHWIYWTPTMNTGWVGAPNCEGASGNTGDTWTARIKFIDSTSRNNFCFSPPFPFPNSTWPQQSWNTEKMLPPSGSGAQSKLFPNIIYDTELVEASYPYVPFQMCWAWGSGCQGKTVTVVPGSPSYSWGAYSGKILIYQKTKPFLLKFKNFISYNNTITSNHIQWTLSNNGITYSNFQIQTQSGSFQTNWSTQIKFINTSTNTAYYSPVIPITDASANSTGETWDMSGIWIYQKTITGTLPDISDNSGNGMPFGNYTLSMIGKKSSDNNEKNDFLLWAKAKIGGVWAESTTIPAPNIQGDYSGAVSIPSVSIQPSIKLNIKNYHTQSDISGIIDDYIQYKITYYTQCSKIADQSANSTIKDMSYNICFTDVSNNNYYSPPLRIPFDPHSYTPPSSSGYWRIQKHYYVPKPSISTGSGSGSINWDASFNLPPGSYKVSAVNTDISHSLLLIEPSGGSLSGADISFNPLIEMIDNDNNSIRPITILEKSSFVLQIANYNHNTTTWDLSNNTYCPIFKLYKSITSTNLHGGTIKISSYTLPHTSFQIPVPSNSNTLKTGLPLDHSSNLLSSNGIIAYNYNYNNTSNDTRKYFRPDISYSITMRPGPSSSSNIPRLRIIDMCGASIYNNVTNPEKFIFTTRDVSKVDISLSIVNINNSLPDVSKNTLTSTRNLDLLYSISGGWIPPASSLNDPYSAKNKFIIQKSTTTTDISSIVIKQPTSVGGDISGSYKINDLKLYHPPDVSYNLIIDPSAGFPWFDVSLNISPALTDGYNFKTLKKYHMDISMDWIDVCGNIGNLKYYSIKFKSMSPSIHDQIFYNTRTIRLIDISNTDSSFNIPLDISSLKLLTNHGLNTLPDPASLLKLQYNTTYDISGVYYKNTNQRDNGVILFVTDISDTSVNRIKTLNAPPDISLNLLSIYDKSTIAIYNTIKLDSEIFKAEYYLPSGWNPHRVVHFKFTPQQSTGTPIYHLISTSSGTTNTNPIAFEINLHPDTTYIISIQETAPSVGLKVLVNNVLQSSQTIVTPPLPKCICPPPTYATNTRGVPHNQHTNQPGSLLTNAMLYSTRVNTRGGQPTNVNETNTTNSQKYTNPIRNRFL